MQRTYKRTSKRVAKWLAILVLTVVCIFLYQAIDTWLFLNPLNNTDKALISLGNPLAGDGHTGRALNVWDLQVFDGKVYVAGGSTVENSGPINVWAYDPKEQRFENEYTVQEEAIEHFRVFNNQLYIPASDPVEGDANKFYRRDVNGKWELFQSPLIELAHVRDLIKLDNGEILLVGNNRNFKDLSKPATAITTDDGSSFTGAGLKDAPDSEFNWFFSVFAYQGKVYAPTSLLKDSMNLKGTIAVYNPAARAFELVPELNNDEFIPQSLLEQRRGKQGFYIIYRPWHPVEFKGALLYPVRSYSYYDRNYTQAYMNSVDFYVKPAPKTTPTRVTFPDGKSVGEDVLVINQEVYVVANHKISSGKFIVYIYKSKDPYNQSNWQEVAQFRSHNRVRSFEYLDGYFYFGMGQNYDESIGRSGDILMLPFRPSDTLTSNTTN
jgi:hypothetical protein